MRSSLVISVVMSVLLAGAASARDAAPPKAAKAGTAAAKHPARTVPPAAPPPAPHAAPPLVEAELRGAASSGTAPSAARAGRPAFANDFAAADQVRGLISPAAPRIEHGGLPVPAAAPGDVAMTAKVQADPPAVQARIVRQP